MAPVAAEKSRILAYVCTALGEPDGQRDKPLDLSYPVLEHQLRPELLNCLESLEFHFGITRDRGRPTQGKPLTIDLYLPGRNLYVELDRAGHDLTPSRAITFHYYPPGLPKGFRPDHWRRLIAELGPTAGAHASMNNGRALVDFSKDLYIEGQLGLTLLRLPWPKLTWLLAKDQTDEFKLNRLRDYLTQL